MQVHNRDIFPEQTLIDVYASIMPLLVNPIIDEAFKAREKAAVTAKNRYHRRGRFAILLVLVSIVSTLSLAYVVPPFAGRAILSILAIILSAVGLSIQIHLLLSKTKQRWLLNRFAAERLRSVKFQAYPLATLSTSTADLKDRADIFYAAEVGHLNAELNAADAVLVQFSPREATTRTPALEVVTAVNPYLAKTACDAYRELRIAYQRRFAADEIEMRKQSGHIASTVADMLYVLGVSLTVCALTVAIVMPASASLERWIDFLALVAFVAGLIKAIMDNASLEETSMTRYEDYVKTLRECDEELTEENAGFPNSVRRIERTALNELAQFCQAAARISYRL